MRKIRAEVAIAFLISVAIGPFASTSLHAQTPPPAQAAAPAQAPTEPDSVVFANGEKLVGHFEGFIAGAAKFKSDKLGEITIDLSKIQELHSSQKFAVVRKGVKLARGERDGQILQGTITVANQIVQVDPGSGLPVQTVKVSELNDIVAEPTFDLSFRSPGVFHGWKGALGIGASLVEATQESESLTGAVNLVRAMPTASQNWLSPSNRMLVVFNESYGTVSQPNTPTVKTSIFHAVAERDQYFSSNVFAFGTTTFDHNYSQGLDLQQLYGGGIGWTIIKHPKQVFDIKASIDYERQSFQLASQDHDLANSVFTEEYTRTLAHGLALHELGSVSPAWTDEVAYSAYASVGLILPVYKKFAVSVNAIDSFLNDPPPMFRKNSVQITTGITYTLN